MRLISVKVLKLVYKIKNTVKLIITTTWEIGTPWELKTATSIPSCIHHVAKDLRNETTSEFRTVIVDSPLGVLNSQAPLYIILYLLASCNY